MLQVLEREFLVGRFGSVLTCWKGGQLREDVLVVLRRIPDTTNVYYVDDPVEAELGAVEADVPHEVTGLLGER